MDKVNKGRGENTESVVPEPFRDLIAYHLRIAQEASFRALAALAHEEGLRPGWYAVLTMLSEHDALTPSELSRICDRDRSTLTVILKSLTSHKLVTRKRDAKDQRSYSVKLTEEGRKVQERLHGFAAEHDRRLDEIVGKHKSTLIKTLRKITAELGGSQ